MLAKETGDRWTDALLHRLRGDILLKRDPAKPALAEEAFKTAIVICGRPLGKDCDGVICLVSFGHMSGLLLRFVDRWP